MLYETTQVRTHDQKHFLRLEKKGLGDVVPPARRKARWAEKRSAGLCDNPSESEQDFSVLHQQASSSSASTLEHQAMHPLLEAVHNLDGQSAAAHLCSRGCAHRFMLLHCPLHNIVSCCPSDRQLCHATGHFLT